MLPHYLVGISKNMITRVSVRPSYQGTPNFWNSSCFLGQLRRKDPIAVNEGLRGSWTLFGGVYGSG